MVGSTIESDFYLAVESKMKNWINSLMPTGLQLDEIKTREREGLSKVISYIFRHNISEVSVIISFSEKKSNSWEDYDFSDMIIENKNERKFSIFDYLKFHHRESEISFLGSKNDQSIADYLDKLLSFFGNLLQNDLKAIIAGEKWEDIPFDWGDFK